MTPFRDSMRGAARLCLATLLASGGLGAPLNAHAQFVTGPALQTGSGAQPGGSTGQLQFNNGGFFGGVSVSGDASFNAGTGALTVSGLNGQSLTAYHASPPAIGGTTPNAGAFSTLTVSGVTGATQCLHANTNGLVSGTGSDCSSGRLMKLGSIAANFNTTADQQITLNGSSSFVVSLLVFTGCSGTGFSTASGGFYSGANKTGNLLFTTGAITFSNLPTYPTIWEPSAGPNNSASRTFYNPTSIYFSLTATSGATATCTITVYGLDLT